MRLRPRLTALTCGLLAAGAAVTVTTAWVTTDQLVLSQVDTNLLVSAQSPGARRWRPGLPVVGTEPEVQALPPLTVPPGQPSPPGGGDGPAGGPTGTLPVTPRTYPASPNGSSVPGGAPLVWLGYDDAGNPVGQSLAGTGLTLLPAPDVAALRGADGALTPAVYATLPAADGSDVTYRAITVAGSDGHGVLVVATPIDDVQDRLARAHLILLTAAGLALVVAGVLAWPAIGRALRPVRRLEAGAAQLAAGDLGHRVEPEGTDDEVDALIGEFNVMADQLQAAFLARDVAEDRLRRFVADASHELRTPLTSILGYTELYEDGAIAPGPDTDRAMARIAAETTRLTDLVNDLLLLARLDQRRPLRADPVDLAVLVADVVADARAADPTRPVAAEVPGPVVVTGDADRLRQVVTNLVTNARLHTGADVPVTVTLAATATEVRITVADEGPGMDQVTAARVFERFYRGGSGGPEETGSGLGLPIAASIAAAHGGRITLDTAPGAGARFTVHLPTSPTVL